MSYYNEQMRNLLSRRTGDCLLHRQWPRTFATFALLLPLACAFSCWNELFVLGIRSTVLRVPLCVLAAYAGYLSIMSLWLLGKSPVDSKSLLINRLGEIRTHRPGDTEFDRTLDEVFEDQIHQASSAEDMVGAMVAIAVLGYLFIAIHFIYHAPWFLGQLMVESGKIRHQSVKASKPLNFLLPPIRQSWVIAVVLTAHYTLIAIALSTMKW